MSPKKVRNAVDKADAPLAGVLITHAHPDHYAGTKTLLGGADVPIIATRRVAEIIRRDDDMKSGVVGPMMGDEWPTERVFPNQTVDPDAVVKLAGLEFVVRDLGPGESPADSMWIIDESTVFAGDVAYHGMHSYPADGYVEEWEANIDRLQSTLPEGATLYLGHGVPAGVEILAEQRLYIDTFVAAVRDHLDEDEAACRTAVVTKMRELVTSDQVAVFDGTQHQSFRGETPVRQPDCPRRAHRRGATACHLKVTKTPGAREPGLRTGELSSHDKR